LALLCWDAEQSGLFSWACNEGDKAACMRPNDPEKDVGVGSIEEFAFFFKSHGFAVEA